jgi:hypothetical protein
MRNTFSAGAVSLLWYSLAVLAADDCQPSTWNKKRQANHVGDIVCRYDTVTSQDVNYYTCAEINDKYELSMDKLLDLNPGLQQDCKNVEPETKYCVKGCKRSRPPFADQKDFLLTLSSPRTFEGVGWQMRASQRQRYLFGHREAVLQRQDLYLRRH